LRSEKQDGAFIATSPDGMTESKGKYKFNIKKDEWLYVHDNIFDLDNWKKVTIEE
jgi:hypothetical protein